MATTSTVPTARAALVTALTAALPETQIAWSHPGDAREPESIYLGEARIDSEVATIRAGRKKRQERYTIDVLIDVAADGPTGQDASERAFVLLGELEDILADDPSLGLPQPFWAALGATTEIPFFDEARRGFGSLLRVGVNCEARLT